MAKDTMRDRVWRAALELDRDPPEYQLSLQYDGDTVTGWSKADLRQRTDAGDRTVHDVVQTMLDYQLIEMVKEPSHASIREHPETGDRSKLDLYRFQRRPSGEPSVPEAETADSDADGAADEHICNVCGESFESERALTTHVTHSADHTRVSEMDTCPECGESYESVTSLDGYVHVVHDSEITDMGGFKMRQVNNSCYLSEHEA